MVVDRGEMAGRDHSSGIPACAGLRRAAMSICSWISSRGAPGLLGLAAIDTELSNLLDGRRGRFTNRKSSADISETRSCALPRCNMPPEDRVRVLHMIEAAETALNFVSGRQRADLNSDQMLLFALVRAIGVVGEAASK